MVVDKLPSQINTFNVLHCKIQALQIEEVTKVFEEWILQRDCTRRVTLCNVHMVMEAFRNEKFYEVLSSADLRLPDGMPLIWLGRRQGFTLPRRVYGPDLFLEFCRNTASKGYKHYLYGGHEGVPDIVASNLRRQCPGIQIVGTCSPPFCEFGSADTPERISHINRSGADVLWVALGCPKQELWMYNNQALLKVPVVVGIGQAFDIYAKRVHQAPIWARNLGVEWAFRLIQEPGRLWRRYLVYNTQFLFWLALQHIGLVKENL